MTVYRFRLPPLRTYQTKLVADSGDEVVCVSSTQVGKTFAYAAKLLAAMWEYRGPHPWWWTCPTYKQSRTAQRVMWELAHSAGILARGPRPPFVTNPPPPLVLINGSECEYRTWDNPANLMGDPIAGGVIDEGGLITPDAHAAISTRRSFTLGPLWWIGNPGIKAGPFRKVCMRAEREGRLHRWTWMDLYNHYLDHDLQRAQKYRDFIATEKDTLPDFEFRRLYLAEWTEDEAAVFRNVEAVTVPNGELMTAEEDRFVIGVDVGQVTDFMAAASMGVNSRKIELREHFRGVSFPQAAQRLKRLQVELNYAPIVIEENNQGVAVIQELQRLGAGYIPFTTTNQSKQEIVLSLAADIQEQRVTVADIQPLPYELAMFRYERTPAGNVRYSAPAGEHDDTVMAAALARWGVNQAVYDYADTGWLG